MKWYDIIAFVAFCASISMAAGVDALPEKTNEKVFKASVVLSILILAAYTFIKLN